MHNVLSQITPAAWLDEQGDDGVENEQLRSDDSGPRQDTLLIREGAVPFPKNESNTACAPVKVVTNILVIAFFDDLDANNNVI